MLAEGPITAPPPLVIGVGNRDRGDDAVGPSVVDALTEIASDSVQTMVAEGDLSDLVLRWGPNQDVMVVDAMVSGREPGSVMETDALLTELPTEPSLVSSHGVGLAETVELARLLHRLPRSLRIFAIEGRSFGQFEALTDEVALAVPDVAAQLAQRLGDL